MKNTRWSRLAACFLALVMLLALAQFAAYASDVENPATENKVPESVDSGAFAVDYVPAPYHETLDVESYTTVSYIGADGKETEPAAMNPNGENSVRLDITGLDADPEITKNTTLVWNIPSNITVVGIDRLSSAEVTGTVEGSALQLTWLGEKADQVTVSVPVIPHIAADDDLSGSYVLVTAGNVMLGAETFNDGGRGKLSSYPVDVDGDVIRPLTTKDSVWRLNHVSGNYYTVYSETAGAYLRIYPKNQGGYSGSGSAALESATEETAQKILVESNGGWYTFQYPDGNTKYGLNNSSEGKFYAGFASYTAENKIQYKFTLYSPGSVTDAPTVDLSGTWMLTCGNRFVSAESKAGGTLFAVAYNPNKDGVLIPNDNINAWTFERVTRDWYYVHSDGNYLNISSSGVSVSGTRQALLARFCDDGTFVLTDGIMDLKNGNTNFLKRSGDTSFVKTAANLTGSISDAAYKMTQTDPDEVANGSVDISGSWAITTASSGAALIVDNNTLKSVPYETREDGKIFYPGIKMTLWDFNRVNGNWYTVSANGKYLSLKDGKLTLSENQSDAKIFIQEYNGEYRLTAGNQFALNNNGGDPTKGYQSYGSGKAVDRNEWHTLRHAFTGVVNTLDFNANGGSPSEIPTAITGEAGDKVILPDIQATKDGHEFIGWYRNTDYYASKANNESSTCRPLLKPGTEYTLPSGNTTLYAVYNKTSRNIRFGIRADGVIQDEPNNYPSGDYKGHFWVNGIRESNTWIIDTNPMKSVNGYYLENNVTASLSRVPTADEIRNALKKEGNIPFDPEAQYIHWYVLKWTGSEWHIDGVIRNKAQVEIAYDANVSDPNEKFNIKDFPGSYQVPVGSQILIGAAKNNNTVLTPQREGYVFRGWNTAADGSGTSYNVGAFIELRENLHLYAQWVDVMDGKLSIMVDSDWPAGKPAYRGTKITLTAKLTGFDNKDYSLQWQYSADNRATWNDISGEDGITMTYEINEDNAHYIWRVVARDVRNKQ